jgi:hypothetical protein
MADTVYNSVEKPIKIDVDEKVTVEASARIKNLDSYNITTIDAEDWLCNYADHAADQKAQSKIKENWKDKYIKLKGEVYRVHGDQLDGYRITIRQQRSKNVSDGWCVICCYFNDTSEIEKLKDIKKGDQVSIIGYSRWDLGPILIDSHIR